mgnify:FL=1
MLQIRRLINKNRKKILNSILVIVFVFLLIYGTNSILKSEEDQKINDQNNNTQKNTTNVAKTESVQNSTDNGTIANTMKMFVNYCNNKKIQEAYNMLTDDCKDAFNFSTTEVFEKNYVNIRFYEEQEYSMVKWSVDGNRALYLIKFYGDLLSTGGEGKESQEYYTFVKEDNGYKININNFIYCEDKNIDVKKDGIEIHIGKMYVYDQYQEVEVSVKNTTENKICLIGSESDPRNVYLENDSNVQYSVMYNKTGLEDGIVNSKNTNIYILKFNKAYSATNKEKYMIFRDIILDYDTYLQSNDKNNYTNRVSIKIKY